MNKILVCAECGFQYDMLHNQPILLYNCRHSICKTCLDAARPKGYALKCPTCKKEYPISLEDDSENQKLRLNSQIADLLHNIKNPKAQVKVRCVCGSQKTNLVCLNQECEIRHPSCFNCSDFLHAECDTRLFVNKKKGFDQQVEISKMIRGLKSLEENFKGWISKEIAVLKDMLLVIVSNKLKAESQIPKIKSFDLETVYNHKDKLNVFYSKKQHKVIVGLVNEEKVEQHMSAYLEAVRDSVKESFGRFVTSIKALKIDELCPKTEAKQKGKAPMEAPKIKNHKNPSKIIQEKIEKKKPNLQNLNQTKETIQDLEPSEKKFSLMF